MTYYKPGQLVNVLEATSTFSLKYQQYIGIVIEHYTYTMNLLKVYNIRTQKIRQYDLDYLEELFIKVLS